MGVDGPEIEMDEPLARSLLRDQHPDLADLPLVRFEAGMDNTMLRLGDTFVLRAPRRELAARLIVNEQRVLSRLAARLPLAVPSPLRIGRPGRGYPWPWSVLPWLPGRSADLEPPREQAASTLVDFLSALHLPPSADAPSNAYRGVPLAERAAVTEARLDRIAETTDGVTRQVREAWRAALDTRPTREARWLHGDLHPRNVLVREGAITGVIDWGDVTVGDPATDLATLWMLFEQPATRTAALDRYGADPDTIRRARGWAVFFGAALLDPELLGDAQHATIGRTTLRRIDEEAR